jgi:NitT/TauT family transport system ATP-binding protein
MSGETIRAPTVSGSNAVDEVSLIVPEGEFVCLIGPSGCGKSTLLQMVAGLDAPSSGAIVVDGKEIAGPGRERGMVFQRDGVFPWLRVVGNVEYGSNAVASRTANVGRSRATIFAGSAFHMSSRRGRVSSPAEC